jgi:conjugative transfer signal peptidase TraF
VLGCRKMTRPRVHRLDMLVLVGMGCAALLCPKASTPLLVWNASPSVPIGFYRAALRPPRTGALAILRLREPHRALAEVRGYLGPRALLIKWVAAVAGDRVCRYGSLVTINARLAAHARASDAAARPLPAWQGCTRLSAGQIFVLSAAPGSFDSRYFGPVDGTDVVGTAAPIWTLAR